MTTCLFVWPLFILMWSFSYPINLATFLQTFLYVLYLSDPASPFRLKLQFSTSDICMEKLDPWKVFQSLRLDKEPYCLSWAITYISICISLLILNCLLPVGIHYENSWVSAEPTIVIKTAGWKSRSEAILVLQWQVMEAFEWSLDRKPGPLGGRWQASLTLFSTQMGRNQSPPADNTTSPHIQTQPKIWC